MPKNFLSRQSNYEILRFDCCEALYQCCVELDHWTIESPPKLADHGRRFVALYVELSKASKNPKLYKLTPKFHLFIHLVEKSVCPRDSWNYWDESEIGRAADMSETVNVPTLSTHLLAKYRVMDFKRE